MGVKCPSSYKECRNVYNKYETWTISECGILLYFDTVKQECVDIVNSVCDKSTSITTTNCYMCHAHRWIRIVAFNNEGILATGSEDTTIKLWNINTGADCLTTLHGHTDHVRGVDFNNKGLLASGSKDSTVRIWNLETKNCLKKLEGHKDGVWSVAFKKDGLLADKNILIFDLTCYNIIIRYYKN